MSSWAPSTPAPTLVALVAATWLYKRRSASESSDTDRGGGVLDAAGVRSLYDRIAPLYDLAASPYNLIGGRRLAKRAITELRLKSGDTVVDLGTGTGWNLQRLAEAVGPTGTVIGVDISPGMLQQARQRANDHGIVNIELVEADVSDYQPPPDTNAIVSTFAIEMRPDYDAIVARLARQISDGGRIVTTGLRNPDGWPEWLIRIGSAVNRRSGIRTMPCPRDPANRLVRALRNDRRRSQEPTRVWGQPTHDRPDPVDECGTPRRHRRVLEPDAVASPPRRGRLHQTVTRLVDRIQRPQ